MARVEESTQIQAPPAVVWAFISDLPRIPEYVHFVREIFDITDGPTGVGTTYRERAKPGPVESASEWRITAFEPSARQVHEGRMPEMHAILTIQLEPQNEGTRYSQAMEFTFLPRLRPLGRLLELLVVRRKMASDFRRILAAVKNIVEAEGQ